MSRVRSEAFLKAKRRAAGNGRLPEASSDSSSRAAGIASCLVVDPSDSTCCVNGTESEGMKDARHWNSKCFRRS